MLREPVAGLITRGTLEALVEARPEWRTPDGAWREYRRWSGRRGVEVGLSSGEKPPFFHEFQDLVEFAVESCPALGCDAFLRLAGRRVPEEQRPHRGGDDGRRPRVPARSVGSEKPH